MIYSVFSVIEQSNISRPSLETLCSNNGAARHQFSEVNRDRIVVLYVVNFLEERRERTSERTTGGIPYLLD